MICKDGNFLFGKEECFLNNGIGFNINVDANVLRKCIQEKSDKSYWENRSDDGDLRSPKNREYLKKILKQFDYNG